MQQTNNFSLLNILYIEQLAVKLALYTYYA